MKVRFPCIRNLRTWIFAVLGGILFAAFDRCGYLLKNYGSIWVISENPFHRNIFLRILCRLPISIFGVFVCICLLDYWKNKKYKLEVPFSRWFSGIRGFFLFWLLYFISFLPAFLGGYPGLFAADAPNQVGWTFSGWLTAHHPLLHTGILCGIFSICRYFQLSDTIAAAIYTVLQMLALSGMFAYFSCFLKREKAAWGLQIGTFLFFCLMPFHALMAIYTTKDTIFSGIFLLCLIQIYQMCKYPETYFQGYQKILAAILLFSLLLLFRNNGFHTLLLCLPFLFFYLRNYWKKILLFFFSVFMVYQFYNGPFLALIGAESGNAREAYSVVMQTLGRTYVAAGDIRPEEMDIIRPVLSEEVLALYTPDLSDSIKNHFHTDKFEENKLEFIKTWLEIGWRNKKIYIDGFLNTTYAFWYPNVNNEYLDFVCFDIEKDNPNYPHVEMQPLNDNFYQYYQAIGTDAVFREIPICREILSMGFYFWLLVFVSFYICYSRQYQKLLWLLPLWTYMGTSLLGPAALLRYAYPLMIAAPYLIYICLKKD